MIFWLIWNTTTYCLKRSSVNARLKKTLLWLFLTFFGKIERILLFQHMVTLLKNVLAAISLRLRASLWEGIRICFRWATYISTILLQRYACVWRHLGSEVNRNHLLKNWQSPASLSLFSEFFKQTSMQFLQEINVKKCPSNMWCWHSNS